LDHGTDETVMKNHPTRVGILHERGQLSPVSSTTITLYLNSATNKRKIERITKLVKHKFRVYQKQILVA